MRHIQVVHPLPELGSHFFTPEVLKISPESVMRDWKLAKVWLYKEMTGG